MSNFVLKILGSLAGANGINSYATTATASATEASDTTTETPTFAAVLKKLNYNIDNASSISNLNALTYDKYSYNSYNKTQSTTMTPNISAIASKIKSSKSSYDVDSQIRQYLLENYGGSEVAVIQNLAGVQNLPAQALSMQDMLFNQIVSKISVQVRDEIYRSQATDISNFSDDSESESVDSSIDSTDISASDFSYF